MSSVRFNTNAGELLADAVARQMRPRRVVRQPLAVLGLVDLALGVRIAQRVQLELQRTPSAACSCPTVRANAMTAAFEAP